MKGKFLVAIILLLFLSSSTIGLASATSPECVVNVLIYFDEEVQAGGLTISEDWWYLTLFEGTLFGDTTYEHFLFWYNIKFHPLNCAWRSYEYWDSPDGETNGYEFLQYAIETHGGVYDANLGEWIFNQTLYYHDGNYHLADLLIFITGEQNLYPHTAYSPPEWNALYILDNNGGGGMTNLHELGHQYGCLHCASNPCVMNPNWVGLWDGYCGTCDAIIRSNREKYGIKIFINIAEKDGGWTSPSEGYGYQTVSGRPFTITAYPDAAMVFYKWYILTEGGSYDFMYSNPLQITATQNTIVEAWFTYTPGSGGGGRHWRK